MVAQGSNRVFDMDFPFVERDVELMFELVSDGACGDGAEHLAIVAGFDLDDADELGHAFGQFFLRHEVHVSLPVRFGPAGRVAPDKGRGRKVGREDGPLARVVYRDGRRRALGPERSHRHHRQH